jgi:hypothetical protein
LRCAAAYTSQSVANGARQSRRECHVVRVRFRDSAVQCVCREDRAADCTAALCDCSRSACHVGRFTLVLACTAVTSASASCARTESNSCALAAYCCAHTASSAACASMVARSCSTAAEVAARCASAACSSSLFCGQECDVKRYSSMKHATMQRAAYLGQPHARSLHLVLLLHQPHLLYTARHTAWHSGKEADLAVTNAEAAEKE